MNQSILHAIFNCNITEETIITRLSNLKAIFRETFFNAYRTDRYNKN